MARPSGEEDLGERYEELRLQALKHVSGGLGLQLFLCRGMAAWMKYTNHIPGGEKTARDKSVKERASSISTQADMVMILAGMALSCAKEGRYDG